MYNVISQECQTNEASSKYSALCHPSKTCFHSI